MSAGSTTTLTATVVPSNATVTWSTSDGDVATVEGGTVTGVAAGSATITASMTYGGTTYTDTCVVTVEAAATPDPDPSGEPAEPTG